MKMLIQQYGQSVLACAATILMIFLVMYLLRGPIAVAVGAFMMRVF